MLESSIVKSQDYARINTFQDNLDVQRAKAEEKKVREENEKHARDVVEKMNELEERKRIEMEAKRKQNDEVLAKADQ